MAGKKDSRAANGASGKKDVLLFDPEDLVLVEDVASAIYDERVKLPVSESLVLNIMTYGILEPVLVRKNQETGKTEVVAGRQRVKACREANKRLKKQGSEQHRVPAIIKRGDPATLMGVMVSENEQREDDTPLGRAKKVARFMDLGRSEDEAAVMMGVSKASIKNMLGLLDAPAAVRKAVESGAITSSDGYKLAKLEPEEAAKRVEKLKTEAPRTPGKKRSSNGAKAREIVDGRKRKKAKPEAVPGEKGVYVRSELDVEQMREKIAEHVHIPGEDKRILDLVFDWLSGNDEAFAEWDAEAAE
jgi:ParB family chromosome partitioning protein